MIIRNLIFLLLLVVVSSKRAASQEYDSFLNDSSLTYASVSASITDVESGQKIFDHNSGKNLTPASVLKLITSAAALELLGPMHRFNTIIGYTGSLNKLNGKLKGDIIIKGGGDPSFASSRFKDHYKIFPGKWITDIKKAGIKKIKGRVITDDSYFDYLPVPSKWLWEDAGNYYGAGAYGASIFDNTYDIHFRTNSDSSRATITGFDPPVSRFELANMVKPKGTADKGYVFAAPYSVSGWITGTVPDHMEDFVLSASITDPPLLFARIINDNLEAAGIKVTEEPGTARLFKGIAGMEINPVSIISSPPLAEIIEVLNHESVNMYAEHLIKELGKKLGRTGSANDGIRIIYQFLENAGLETRGIFIEDGSGLSPVNSINAGEMVKLLIHMKTKGKYFADYLNSLPEAGREGTLKNCFRDSVFTSLKAKSGSMTRVKSLAGFFTTASGREMAFCFITNDFIGPSGNIVRLYEDVIKEIILNN